MGDKGNNKTLFSSIARFFSMLLCGNKKTNTKAAAASEPEASIVSASKHFSSAHKVKFN
jgi:hypothetical protein